MKQTLTVLFVLFLTMASASSTLSLSVTTAVSSGYAAEEVSTVNISTSTSAISVNGTYRIFVGVCPQFVPANATYTCKPTVFSYIQLPDGERFRLLANSTGEPYQSNLQDGTPVSVIGTLVTQSPPPSWGGLTFNGDIIVQSLQVTSAANTAIAELSPWWKVTAILALALTISLTLLRKRL